MTYITQKMDLVMIGFHIEYPGAEKYTSPIPQHLFPHKFVHQEEGMGVYKKNERVQSNIISDTEVWFLKKGMRRQDVHFCTFIQKKKLLGTHSATSLLSVKYPYKSEWERQTLRYRYVSMNYLNWGTLIRVFYVVEWNKIYCLGHTHTHTKCTRSK